MAKKKNNKNNSKTNPKPETKGRTIPKPPTNLNNRNNGKKK